MLDREKVQKMIGVMRKARNMCIRKTIVPTVVHNGMPIGTDQAELREAIEYQHKIDALKSMLVDDDKRGAAHA